jgi:hypothetical protein
MSINNDRAYMQVYIGSQITAHQVTTRIGNHWRHAVLSQERNGVQVDYGVFCFSSRAPQIILPIEVIKGFKGRIIKEQYDAKTKS